MLSSLQSVSCAASALRVIISAGKLHPRVATDVVVVNIYEPYSLLMSYTTRKFLWASSD